MIMYAGRATTQRIKFRLILLRDSMKRRLDREMLLWETVPKNNQPLWRVFVKHIAQRSLTDLRDGIKKLRSPEKSLTILS
jgi:hypothetical protein